MSTALTTALLDHGWTIQKAPGEPVKVKNNGTALEPTRILPALKSGEFTEAKWNTLIDSAGIADLDLGAVKEAAEIGDDSRS